MLNWDCWGGLADLVYQVAVSSNSLRVHGPAGLVDLSLCSRYFLYSPGFNMYLNEIHSPNCVSLGKTKEEIKVYSVITDSDKPFPIQKLELMKNPLFLDVLEVERMWNRDPRVLSNLDRCEKFLETTPEINYSEEDIKRSSQFDMTLEYDRPIYFPKPRKNNQVISYCVHTPIVPPKFDPKKAEQLGVKDKKLFGKLNNGESVTLSDGKVVNPQDCFIGEPTPGPVLLVIYCPSTDYINNLVSNPFWDKYYSGPNNEHNVGCIVHMTPEDVAIQPKYIEWFSKFSNADNMFLNRKMSIIHPIFARSANFVSGLNYLDEHIFPKPLDTIDESAPYLEKILSVNPKVKLIKSEVLQNYTLLPIAKKGVEASGIKVHPFKSDDILKIGNFKDNRNTYVQEKSSKTPDASIPYKFEPGEVVLDIFGTAAADPSHTRNVSGMILRMRDRGGLLVDPGSGTYHQMYRKYGHDKLKEVLRDIKCIWLSHKHPDHHTGIIPVLIKRQQALVEAGIEVTPICIVGPRIFEGYLREYSLSSTTDLVYDFYHYSVLSKEDHALKGFFYKTFGFVNTKTLKMIHGGDACCLIVTHEKGWKVAISGDGRPSQQFADNGKDCLLLIHEASFCNRDKDLAMKKAHSTTAEARYVAHEMGASYLLMTHFSQRLNVYPVRDFAPIDAGKDEDDDGTTTEPDENLTKFNSTDEIKGIGPESPQIDVSKIIFAFDLMTVDFNELHILPKMLPSLIDLYMSESNTRKKKK
eukprot:TRINITY_DN5989_c0_g1_i4.p1 TRINITY_DN5989_c0_g1~~TRINITY_DN5989_c0_g1_i4.p1  ORF type:complete len:750 (-),score=146.91 TRINITY_DN5989_c0_g1_i4:8-2257(-)